MTEMSKPKAIARSEQLNMNLQGLFNSIIMLDFNYPVFHHEKNIEVQSRSTIKPEDQGNLVKNLGNVETLIKTMNLLKISEKVEKTITPEQAPSATQTVSSIIFSRPVKHHHRDEKVIWIVKGKQKQKLSLDNPQGVLILPNEYLIAIERKYINLYQIEDKLGVSLKDFDSNGLGKKFTYVDVKHVSNKGHDYVLIFGNQKYHFNSLFACLIFEVTQGKLRFVKKAVCAEKEIVSPTILFENDPSSKDAQKFCLVMGGCCDNFENYHYSALKLNLHILLDDFLTYDQTNTTVIPFSRKVVLLSGKAINYKEAWYCFCSEEQTINEVLLQYGGPGKSLTMIDIKSEKLNLKEKIYFSQDSMQYVYEADQDKIVFLDRSLNLKQRSLNDILYKLKD